MTPYNRELVVLFVGNHHIKSLTNLEDETLHCKLLSDVLTWENPKGTFSLMGSYPNQFLAGNLIGYYVRETFYTPNTKLFNKLLEASDEMIEEARKEISEGDEWKNK